MKKKGFTLIELVAVMAIIGLLAGITIPIIVSVIKDSREKSYERQKQMILDAAERYVNEYALEFNGSEITISDLWEKGYLNSKDIKDPRKPAKNIEGCVKVSIDNKKYSYTFDEYCS